MTPVTLHDSDPTFTAVFHPVDAKGNPTAPDDIPVWSVSDATILQVSSTTPDGLTAVINIVGVEGTATLAVTSIDANGTVISATQDYTVAAGEAVNGSIETVIAEVVPAAEVVLADAVAADAAAAAAAAAAIAAADAAATVTADPAPVPAETAPVVDTPPADPAPAATAAEDESPAEEAAEVAESTDAAAPVDVPPAA